MNKFFIMGRLVRDPEERSTADGKTVSRYTVAVDRRRKKDAEQVADFFNCVTFDKSAEFAAKHFRKGMRILVVGHVQTGSYTNKDGVKIPTFDIVVDEQEFADGKAQNAAEATQKPHTGTKEAFMDIPADVDAEGLPWA